MFKAAKQILELLKFDWIMITPRECELLHPKAGGQVLVL